MGCACVRDVELARAERIPPVIVEKVLGPVGSTPRPRNLRRGRLDRLDMGSQVMAASTSPPRRPLDAFCPCGLMSAPRMADEPIGAGATSHADPSCRSDHRTAHRTNGSRRQELVLMWPVPATPARPGTSVWRDGLPGRRNRAVHTFLMMCRRRDVPSRSSASSTMRLSASSASTARSSAIAPRSTISTTSWSTTATGRSRPRAPAFNVGASRARHDHLVFVHQDVVLHSLSGARARGGVSCSADPGIGLAGAIGVERAGRLVGRVRDRVVLDRRAHQRSPVDVDAIDEVLFIVPRRVFDHERLSEAPTFAWHAYAVEYGLRLRRDGLRVCAVDVPLTHNSLSHERRRISTPRMRSSRARYPDALPVRTPNRIVTRSARPRVRGGLIPRHGVARAAGCGNPSPRTSGAALLGGARLRAGRHPHGASTTCSPSARSAAHRQPRPRRNVRRGPSRPARAQTARTRAARDLRRTGEAPSTRSGPRRQAPTCW